MQISGHPELQVWDTNPVTWKGMVHNGRQNQGPLRRNTGLGLVFLREFLSITNIKTAETGEPGRGGRLKMAAGKKKGKKVEDKDTDHPGIERSLRDDAEKQLSRSPKSSLNFAGKTTGELIHELWVHQIELETQAEELRKSQLALEESRDKYLDLYEFAPIGYFTISDKAFITDVNLTGAVLLGVERNNLLMARFSKFFAETDSEQWHRDFVNVLNKGEKLICHPIIRRGDGSMFPARLEGVRITGNSDGMVTVRIAISDITDIRKTEEALQESELLFREVIDNANDSVFLLERTPGGPGKYLLVNDKAVRMLGYSKEDLLTMSPRDIVPEDIAKKIMPFVRKKLKKDGYATFESAHRKKDGSIYPVEVSTHTFRYKGRDVDLSIVRDITGRKVAENALRQTNKKLTLLSGITRHDINNQLTVLMGYLELLDSKQPDAIFNEYFQKVSTAANRISAMVRFTKEYEEIGVKDPAWQNCRTLVDTTAKQVPHGQVKVENNLPVGAKVFADPLVVKVFYNLMDNAVRYGGKITTIRFSVEEAGDVHRIVCEDDGVGIPAIEKEKIFERGFGKNTGLGLALSREILDITGISIREAGEPGNGARFEMTVPKGTWRMVGEGA